MENSAEFGRLLKAFFEFFTEGAFLSLGIHRTFVAVHCTSLNSFSWTSLGHDFRQAESVSIRLGCRVILPERWVAALRAELVDCLRRFALQLPRKLGDLAKDRMYFECVEAEENGLNKMFFFTLERSLSTLAFTRDLFGSHWKIPSRRPLGEAANFRRCSKERFLKDLLYPFLSCRVFKLHASLPVLISVCACLVVVFKSSMGL